MTGELQTVYGWISYAWRRISPFLQILVVAIFFLLNWLFAIVLVIILGLWGYRGRVKAFFSWAITTFIRNHIGDFRFGRKHRKYAERQNKKKKHWEGNIND